MAILRGLFGSSLFALFRRGLSVRLRRRYRITPSVGASSCSWHILLGELSLDAARASTLAMSVGEYFPWNLLPSSLSIQNIAVSAISSAVTPRRGFRGQGLFVSHAHAVSEPFEALLSHPSAMVSSTLARMGQPLIISKTATLTRGSGYVKRRLYELLNLDCLTER